MWWGCQLTRAGALHRTETRGDDEVRRTSQDALRSFETARRGESSKTYKDTSGVQILALAWPVTYETPHKGTSVVARRAAPCVAALNLSLPRDTLPRLGLRWHPCPYVSLGTRSRNEALFGRHGTSSVSCPKGTGGRGTVVGICKNRVLTVL